MTKSCEISSKIEFDKNDFDKNDHKIKSGSPLLVHTRERYKEYDGCYLGHYAQLSFGFSSLLVFCGCRRCWNNDCTVL